MKVVVFGLGKTYEKHKNEIKKKFEVIGVSSNDDKDSCLKKYIHPYDLLDMEYDNILICSEYYDAEIFHQLVDDLKIDMNKILLHRQLFRRETRAYSEHYEDLFIDCIFKLIGINDNITYLDLGANHPIYCSNTYRFYDRSNGGVLVEANPELKSFIQFTRPNDILINKAITLDGKPVRFNRLAQLGLSTVKYESINKDTLKRFPQFRIRKSYDVDGIKINDIVNFFENGCDLLSIDLEGMDWDILQSIDFDEFRPKIVVAETGNTEIYGQHNRDDFTTFFNENGYCLFENVSINSIYFDERFKKELEDLLI